MARAKIVKGCINQDTGRLLKPGDIVPDMSEMEFSRHLAEGNAVPVTDAEIERAVAAPPEKRRRRRGSTKKKTTEGHGNSTEKN